MALVGVEAFLLLDLIQARELLFVVEALDVVLLGLRARVRRGRRARERRKAKGERRRGRPRGGRPGPAARSAPTDAARHTGAQSILSSVSAMHSLKDIQNL